MRLSRKLAVAAAIVGAVSLLVPSSAYASGTGAGAVVVVGAGSIQPGLTPDPTMPTMQTVTFQGTAAGLGIGIDAQTEIGVDVAALQCQFAGGSHAPGESSLLGSGHVNGNCTGSGLFGPVGISCNLEYRRQAALVEIWGRCTLNAQNVLGQNVTVDLTVVGVFVFVPAVGLPTQQYQLVGAAVGVGDFGINPKTLPIP
jgi:hypothetical protein